MSKKERHPFAKALDRGGRSAATRPLPASRNQGRAIDFAAADADELSIELLEERLTPGYPVRAFKKSAGWGC